jgi:hypothetical protein
MRSLNSTQRVTFNNFLSQKFVLIYKAILDLK